MSDAFDSFDPLPPSYDFAAVDLLTVGTQGQPGQRLFFFQARSGPHLVTMKVEKEQAAVLAEYLFQVLADLPDCGPLPQSIDPQLPADPDFAVSSIGVSYEEDRDRILLLLEEFDDVEEAGDEELTRLQSGVIPARVRIRATREQATAFAARCIELVESGRPPCPLCGHPLDPRGHVCPRTNGKTPPRV